MSPYIEKAKAVADETRFRLLRILVEAGTALCIAELTDIVRKPQYTVSRAIGQLADAGLVEESRRGKQRFYAPRTDPYNEHIFALVSAVPSDDTLWLYDQDRLRWRLDIRVAGSCVVTYPAGYVPEDYRVTAGDDTGRRPATDSPRPRVLFICVHNSARSQMAEAYLRQFAGDLLDVESAGLTPGTLNPYVVEAMRQDGIDISGKKPRGVVGLYESGRTYSYVITVCSREAEKNCPVFPGPVRRLSWPFADPSGFKGSDAEILEKTIEVRNHVKQTVRRFAQHIRESRVSIFSTAPTSAPKTQESK